MELFAKVKVHLTVKYNEFWEKALKSRIPNKILFNAKIVVKKYDPNYLLLDNSVAREIINIKGDVYVELLYQIKSTDNEKILRSELLKYNKARISLIDLKQKLDGKLSVKENKDIDNMVWLLNELKEAAFETKYPYNRNLLTLIKLKKDEFEGALAAHKVGSKWMFQKNELVALAKVLNDYNLFENNISKDGYLRQVLARQFDYYFQFDLDRTEVSSIRNQYQEFIKMKYTSFHYDIFKKDLRNFKIDS